MTNFFFCFILIFLSILPFTVSKVIQVSLTGNTTTLLSACKQAAPGDIIEFTSGLYPPQEVPKNTTGTYDKPIIIRSALNAKVTFETFTGDKYVFQVFNSSNIIVEGPFIVRSGTWLSVSARNSTNVTISNFSIYNSTNWAIFASGVNITIKNNFADGCVLAHENCKTDSWLQCFGTAAIDSYAPILSSNIVFENNEIINAWGEAIDVILCTNCVVKNNYLHNNNWCGIYVDNSCNVIIENNEMRYDTSHRYSCSKDNRFHGIGIGNEDWPVKCVSTTNITVRNNLVLGAPFGIGYWGWSDVAYYSDITIANNNFVNVDKGALDFKSECVVKGKTRNNQFKNNFIYSTLNQYTAVINKSEENTWNISSNVYYGGYEKILQDTWNGSDGNAHSIHLKENEMSFDTIFQRGLFRNCSNESYYNWDVESYCLIPQKQSILKNKGVFVSYSDLDGKVVTDFFGCARNSLKPSVGMSEGDHVCNIDGTKNLFVVMVVVCTMLLFL
ncbi:hypothetical protein EIN_262650 [Entamoeba invadens IP1]|uniref:Right handed beta helix domain-containing protein n=1 Tax=Entamoeba invadens IP1 TaxID=370355 RepID=A0A0A1U1I6_ENTIV|nr:hypothetical protein EIN_262650 [Entamoeba invadens IP1]ELP84768.1 hypothetical protein EIN_262650 [Entamoeba invadens IP1]|eukprot:XP_004184114.1 hypothetical protein EIN_262650 [Entamoeba invadens IP1]